MLNSIVTLIMFSMLYSGAQSVQILVSTEDGIFLTDIHKNLTDTLLSDKHANVHSFDYHHKKSYLYFISDEQLKRLHFNKTNDNEPVIISLKNMTKEDLVRSVAVDWVRDRLYWTKSNHHGSNVIVSNLSGKHAKHIISMEDLEHHHRLRSNKHFCDIVVDPDEGLLFVIAAQKTRCIGSIIRINLEGPFNWATIHYDSARSIAIDAQKKRLFVLHGSGEMFYSCNYHGRDVHMTYGSGIANAFPLSISKNKIYYVHRHSFIYELHDESMTLIGGKVVFSTNRSHIYTMKVFERRNQLTEYKYDQEQCRRKHCSHGCQIDSKQGVFCTCPVELDLDSNGITCKDSETAVSTSPYDSTTIQPKRFTNSSDNHDSYNRSTEENDENLTDGENKSNSYRHIILISSVLLLAFSTMVVCFIWMAHIKRKRNNKEIKCSVLLSQVNCEEESLILEI